MEDETVVHVPSLHTRLGTVRALMFDVHGLVVPCTHPEVAFDPHSSAMTVHANVRKLVKWATDHGFHVAFVSYGAHKQIDPLLRAGLGDELYEKVVVVTPSDSDQPWRECYGPPSAELGKHTLCLRAAQLLVQRGAPLLELSDMLLFEDNATNAERFVREGGANAVLFMGAMYKRTFGELLEKLELKFDADDDPLGVIWRSAEPSFRGYMVVDY